MDKGQQDEPQPGYYRPEGQHDPRAIAVGQVTHYRPLDSAHQPAQHIGQGDGGDADAQLVADGNDVDGEGPG